MLRGIQLVLREARHTRAIQKAIVRQRAMIRSGKRELSDAVALGIRIDPEKQIFSRANTDRKLVLRRTRKSGVDDVDMAGDHRTP